MAFWCAMIGKVPFDFCFSVFAHLSQLTNTTSGITFFNLSGFTQEPFILFFFWLPFTAIRTSHSFFIALRRNISFFDNNITIRRQRQFSGNVFDILGGDILLVLIFPRREFIINKHDVALHFGERCVVTYYTLRFYLPQQFIIPF